MQTLRWTAGIPVVYSGIQGLRVAARGVLAPLLVPEAKNEVGLDGMMWKPAAGAASPQRAAAPSGSLCGGSDGEYWLLSMTISDTHSLLGATVRLSGPQPDPESTPISPASASAPSAKADGATSSSSTPPQSQTTGPHKVTGGVAVTAVALGWRPGSGTIKLAFVVPEAKFDGGWKTRRTVNMVALSNLVKRAEKGECGCR